MTVGKIYKHKDNTDVAILILTKPYFTLIGLKYRLKINWMNVVNPKNVYSMNLVETILINNKDMSNWELYENK